MTAAPPQNIFKAMINYKSLILAGALASAAFICGCASDDAEDAPKTTPEPEEGIMGISYVGETEISYCRTAYMSDAETRTIPEIFTGEEFTYGYLTMRSQPAKRAGMYFYIMISGPDEIPLASVIELSLDCSQSPKTKHFKFTVPETHGLLREIKLGITGDDWPSPTAKVNAWKIVIKSPLGKVVTQKQSWLWSAKNKDLEETPSTDAPAKEDAASTLAQAAQAPALPAAHADESAPQKALTSTPIPAATPKETAQTAPAASASAPAALGSKAPAHQ